jgi:hypothetical protein
MYIRLHANRYSCQILMKLEFSRQIFEEYSDIKFQENPSSGRRVVPCGETDMTKVIVAFHNYAKAPKNLQLCLHYYRTLNHTAYTLHAVHIAAYNKGHTLSVPLLQSLLYVFSDRYEPRLYISPVSFNYRGSIPVSLRGAFSWSGDSLTLTKNPHQNKKNS